MYLGVGDQFDKASYYAGDLTGRDGKRYVIGYRSQQVLAYVTRMIEQGIVPSYAMIADNCGVSTTGKVCEIVKRLERRGLLKRQAGARYARRIRLG